MRYYTSTILSSYSTLNLLDMSHDQTVSQLRVLICILTFVFWPLCSDSDEKQPAKPRHWVIDTGWLIMCSCLAKPYSSQPQYNLFRPEPLFPKTFCLIDYAIWRKLIA